MHIQIDVEIDIDVCVYSISLFWENVEGVPQP